MNDPRFLAFLQQLAETLNFETLAPDENEACLVEFKEGLVPLLFEYDDSLVPQTVLVSSEICDIPHEIFDFVIEEALKENGRQEEILSVQPQSLALFLHRRIHPDIKSASLTPVIEHFVNVVRRWRDKVAFIEKNPPAPVELPSPRSTFSLKQKKV